MVATALVLIAVFVAVKSLTAFGYGAREIFGILWPMAILVALFFAGLTYTALWTVRRLNRGSQRPQPPDASPAHPRKQGEEPSSSGEAGGRD